MIHKSPFPEQVIPDTTLTDFVFADAATRAGKAAFVDGPTGRVVTYGEVVESIRRFGGGLAESGFGPGDVLAIMAPNVPEYATAFHGAALAGGAVTTINPTYTAREVHHQLEDSGATLLLTVPAFLGTAQEGAEGTKVASVAVLGDTVADAPGLPDLMGEPLAEQVPVAADDVVALPYSSGTTGLSKGVMLTHRNLVAALVQAGLLGELDETDTIIAVLPFFHIYGMQLLMNFGLWLGATVVTMPRFELEPFLRLHQDHGVTHSFMAPPMVLAVAKDPTADRYDLSKLTWIMSAAAPLSAEQAIETSERIKCAVVQGYGMTELSPVSHFTPSGEWKPGSVGVTAPNTETMIVDPGSGEALGFDQDGEVWVRGPQVMKGYLNNPSATAATVVGEGWLRTGDIGHMDPDGHLFIVDRLKELIKYKGFQVPPAELEALLLTHPAVADAAVVGLPDEEAGEVPVGFVTRKAGRDVTETEIADYVAERVSTYKKLRTVTFVDEIPKSPSGKILRRLLRDEAAGTV